MSGLSLKDSFDTPAVEIPVQKVAPGRLAGKVENIEFQTLFCRQSVVRYLDALEDGLNEKSIHIAAVKNLFGGFIDTSKALLSANQGMADRHLLELFCDRFAETVLLIGEKMKERGIESEFGKIMMSKLGIIDGSKEYIKAAILRNIPISSESEDEWGEYEGRPTNPYNEDMALRLQRYIESEEQLRQVKAPSVSRNVYGSQHLAPQNSLSPTDCIPTREAQNKSVRDKIVVISAIVGLGALTAAGITTFGKKDNYQVSAGAPVVAKPRPASLSTAYTPDATTIAETDVITEKQEKIICSADTAASGFANYMKVIRQGNPLLADLMDQAFTKAVIETQAGNEGGKVIILEKALDIMKEMNRNTGNTGYTENIATFVDVHSATLNKYKKSGVWRNGQEQTRLLYDKLRLDCQNEGDKRQ